MLTGSSAVPQGLGRAGCDGADRAVRCHGERVPGRRPRRLGSER